MLSASAPHNLLAGQFPVAPLSRYAVCAINAAGQAFHDRVSTGGIYFILCTEHVVGEGEYVASVA